DYLLANVPKALDRSLHGLNRVAEIVKAMKAFTHAAPGEMVAVDINQTVASMLVISHNDYASVADVETEFDTLPVVVCQPSELSQAMLNIMANASQAMGEVAGETGK